MEEFSKLKDWFGGGVGGMILAGSLWLGYKYILPLIASKAQKIQSDDEAVTKLNDAVKGSIERLEKENERLAKKLQERDAQYDVLEREHDLMLAQLRQIKREVNTDALDLLQENKELEKRIEILEKELAIAHAKIDLLKKQQNGNDYNPISSE